jgi:lysophospholipase L1-like esterase
VSAREPESVQRVEPRRSGRHLHRARPTLTREFVARIGLGLLGILLALVLIEVLLRAGAAYVAGGRANAKLAHDGARRVVCLGDSNTYGLYVNGEEAYPALLQRDWNEVTPSRPIEVLNLGMPGNNSSRIRNALPRLLATYRPDVITVMVGVNDWWTVPEPVAAEAAGVSSLLWRASRTYRLAFMLWRANDPASTEGPGRMAAPRRAGPKPAGERWGWATQPGGVAEWEQGLRRNLEAIVEEARRFAVPIVLLTYPADVTFYGTANGVLRDTARLVGTPLVDLAAAVGPECTLPACRNLLFPDYHPTARGHALAARALTDALAAAGVVP